MTLDISTSDLAPSTHDEQSVDGRARERHDREETLSVAASSIAAAATAWSAFEAATWSSKQTFAIATSTRLRQLSTEARLESDQQLHLDANLFVSFAGAYAEGRDPFARFLYDRFPPRLKTATDAWLATKPLVSRDAPPYPMAMPEYRLEARDKALALGKQADDVLDEGQTANRIADTYVLGTVVLATIILLASISVRLRRQNPRRVMLVVSVVGLLGALAWIALRPVAWVGA